MAKIETQAFEVARAFDHKTHGRIGIVELKAEAAINLNGTTLPASSVEYLLTFALQNLQDAYAGAESAAEAQARFAKKLDRLIAGTIGTREAGDGASAETRMVRVVLGELLRKSEAGKAKLAERQDDRDAFLDEVFAKQAPAKQDEIKAEAAKRIEAQAAKAKKAKAMADSIEL